MNSTKPQYVIDIDLEKQAELGHWVWVKRDPKPTINNAFGGLPLSEDKSVFCLNDDVKEWCDANIPKRHRYARPYDVLYTQAQQVQILFWDSIDIIHFKMRWSI